MSRPSICCFAAFKVSCFLVLAAARKVQGIAHGQRVLLPGDGLGKIFKDNCDNSDKLMKAVDHDADNEESDSEAKKAITHALWILGVKVSGTGRNLVHISTSKLHATLVTYKLSGFQLRAEETWKIQTHRLGFKHSGHWSLNIESHVSATSSIENIIINAAAVE
ncbi:hypothetical protein DFH07DRAFT_771915 [Mycena maculata]|uniref:Uncharacterized protein n=1 Tax=Mycena maculata TaxID=230809 RepID=A0AAD7JAB0_9AGAR|nr:hypothetical protein DFH07DRAFT_771915 [Mycena maculata]